MDDPKCGRQAGRAGLSGQNAGAYTAVAYFNFEWSEMPILLKLFCIS